MMTRIQRAKIAYWRWQPSPLSFALGVLTGTGFASALAHFVKLI